jgi:hypothetical protein
MGAFFLSTNSQKNMVPLSSLEITVEIMVSARIYLLGTLLSTVIS